MGVLTAGAGAAASERRSRFSDLLEARSVVLVGASDRDDNIAGSRPIRIAAQYESPLPLYLVNPKFDPDEDRRRYRSLAELPLAPDLALLSLPADAVVSAIRAGSEIGIDRYVVFSAGFGHGSESERARLSDLEAVVAAADVTVLGPGSLGFASLRSGLFGTFSGAFQLGLQTGSVALVSQSGALITTISGYLHRAGIGLDLVVATGAQLQVTVEDALLAAVRGSDARTIVCFLEEVRDAEVLLAAIAEAGDERTVIVMSGGETSVGASAARSHTGAQVGSFAMLRDLVVAAGARWAGSLPELVEIARLSQILAPAAAPRRIGVLTNSGGAGVLAADALVRAGFELPPLGDATARELAAQLPPYVSPGSPLDVGDRLIRAPQELPGWVETLAADPEVDAILLAITSIFRDEDKLAEAVAEAVSRAGVPVIPVFLPPLPGRGEFSPSVEDAVAGLRGLVAPPPAPRHESPPAAAPAAALAVDEVDAKQLIATAGGFERPPHVVLERPPADPAAALGDLAGPFVVKLAAPGLGQRLSKGLVIRHVEGADGVAAALEVIASRRPDGVGGRYLIEQEIPEGLDLVMAAHRDPSFGPVLVVGLGGSFAGLFGGDLWIRRPSGPEEVLARLDGREWWLAVSERMGLTESERRGCAAAACGLVDLLERDRSLTEIEVNPVRVAAGRVWSLDGRASRRP